MKKPTWYRKYQLISSKYSMVVPFGDGESYTSYNLKIRVVYFWGLFNKTVTMPFKISMYHSIEQFEEHWKRLIKTGEYIEL